ncbi:Actin protein 2/3 complex subunit-like protein [Quillaja saponaria]|uniref:Actin protein 2/3 complex subunit-like protein n=1 Tax=Quillaja saponaria TaxID=32244 RepID=A0AAD7P9X2_QUISA|nr:Actin protein 2/3 complex subunit-like protein [Quillaja saponaria]
MDLSGPLDFELEDPFLASPAIDKKKRKKVIGLDDLLADHYSEQEKLVQKKFQQEKARKVVDSDDDDDGSKAIQAIVEKCQNEIQSISGEEETSVWGVQVFGNQKVSPPLDFPELGNCKLMQSFLNNKLNSMLELTEIEGGTFFEGLLKNGWLLKLAFMCGHVEKPIATWAFNLMLYSSEEDLRTSSCDFLCSILSSTYEVNKRPVKIDWLPDYHELRRALEIYGFLFNFSTNSDPIHNDSDFGGPPQNIRAWIQFVTTCCQIRNKHSIFSTTEAEELVEIIICLFLDRQLQGLLVLMCDCMQSVVSYFTGTEWSSSCESIAKFISSRVSIDINSLRTVECISGLDTRTKQLRSAIAYQILLVCFDNKVAGGDEIMRSLISINLKDKSCDLFKMYIYLVLTENWLLSNQMLEDKPVIKEMFGLYLRNCSCQISSTDLRTYSAKIRVKASYLLQFALYK